MMRWIVFFTSLLLTVPLAVGQEGAQPGPDPRGQARGIGKKDIRALIVYPDNVYSPADVQRMEASVRPVVDAIASGAKLTKADAARQAGLAAADPAVIQQIEESLGRDQTVFLEMSLEPASASNRPRTPSGNIIVKNIRKKWHDFDGFVVVVVPPSAPPQMGQKLADAAVITIQTEPWPARLVIKTKSTPP
jgi:hypothetical protein